jgi:hypothetical protein
MLTACSTAPAVSNGAVDRAPIGKADQTGSCQAGDADYCGGKSDGNCWCDDQCDAFGDCCADKPIACDGEEPGFCAEGTIETETVFAPSSDGKECSTDVEHCLTDDFGACPQFSPLPPDFCAEGRVVTGPDHYITAADGMECSIPSVHCVTNDGGACPQFSPPPPDYCADGVLVSGPSSFIAAADGMECQIPSLHCLTNDLDACEPDEDEFCEDGELVEETVFTAGDEAFECVEAELHCLSKQFDACPFLAPLPPDFCEDGEIVTGPTSWITAADGNECALPSVHCVTRDGGACPQFSPLPPDFCEGGDVVEGDSSFIPATDGMECELSSVHCVTDCS